MSSLQPVRGTHDLLPAEMRRHREVLETARAVADRFGFDEIATPIFEKTEVFKRTLGDTSDVVTKEMYTFEMKEGEEITLRPENTAGVARAFMSNGLSQQLPVKFLYCGPMFRHERPQKGRQRQFHQAGVELLGVEKPQGDIEVISLGVQFLKELGVYENTVLELNTLGDSESRAAYRSALVEYFSAYRDQLSEDSLNRLEKNPLRILDSKDEGDRKLVADAPVFSDYLNEHSRAFFAEVRAGLDALDIPYTINPRLVRGLDYYCHTAFEFTTTALGAQGTVLAGGRYDDLVKTMGGPATPGVGWASGVERLSMLMTREVAEPRPVAIIPMGEEAEKRALVLANNLRLAGFRVEQGYSGNLKKRLIRANKLNACAAIIMGDDELAENAATLRDLVSGDQSLVKLDQMVEKLSIYR
ncbi:histidine--tRNA ligase [Kiloniella laminariae]|uniref:histidine--tRNA ligase n=1 Tax=Kiloniella laminariae TaxID=454162 RepID=UPI00037BB885|nr:histidine--tRNA ligase [Kiloniella laminariae]